MPVLAYATKQLVIILTILTVCIMATTEENQMIRPSASLRDHAYLPRKRPKHLNTYGHQVRGIRKRRNNEVNGRSVVKSNNSDNVNSREFISNYTITSEQYRTNRTTLVSDSKVKLEKKPKIGSSFGPLSLKMQTSERKLQDLSMLKKRNKTLERDPDLKHSLQNLDYLPPVPLAAPPHARVPYNTRLWGDDTEWMGGYNTTTDEPSKWTFVYLYTDISIFHISTYAYVQSIQILCIL